MAIYSQITYAEHQPPVNSGFFISVCAVGTWISSGDYTSRELGKACVRAYDPGAGGEAKEHHDLVFTQFASLLGTR